MPCRTSRLVTSLLLLTVALPAVEVVTLKNGGSEVRVTVADELQIEAPANLGAGRAGRRFLAVPGGRSAVQETARRLLASGEATRTEPVLYLDGRLGDAASRVMLQRRLMVTFVEGTDPASLLREHGLRPVAAVAGVSGSWMAEPLSPDVYATLDAARSLGGDARCTQVWPEMSTPVATRLIPNDPALNPPNPLPWHLTNARPGINVQEVWDTYKGEGTGVAITDGGIQFDHLDLYPNYRAEFSRDYINGDLDPRPVGAADNHGTAVAGLAVAVGNNGIGTAGIAYRADFIASKLINNYSNGRFSGADYLPADSLIRLALTGTPIPTAVSQSTWVNNCSWGPIDDATGQDFVGPLTLTGMREATTLGRKSRGMVLVFPAGNGGWSNPNGLIPIPLPFAGTQDCTSFDPYLTRFVIGVGAYQLPAPGNKCYFSESGPNLTISAPGAALLTTDRTTRAYSTPNPSSDNLGFTLWDGTLPIDYTYPPGDYTTVTGTSFAAPIVSGAAALMMQARPELGWRDVRAIMQHRGQDYLVTPFAPGAPQPHDGWGLWRGNASGLLYNNWFGFGGVDVGRFIYGGDGTFANRAAATSRDEPGTLRWPLLPALVSTPLFYEESFPVPLLGAPDPYMLRDAPHFLVPETNVINRQLVWDPGISIELLDPRSRAVNVTLPINTVPPRFRIDSVELTVRLNDVGKTTYAAGFFPMGHDGGFGTGDYVYTLTSPNGYSCLLGRQRPGVQIVDGGNYQVTMTELFHTNELLTAGNWTLSVLDEANDLDDNFIEDPIDGNPPECRVSYVAIRIYGHQTYTTPSLVSTPTTGLASGGGDQVIELIGNDFAISGSGVSATQVYWRPTLPVVGPAVELATTVTGSTRLTAVVPGSLLPATQPGSGTVFLANPSVVVGRAGGIDAFDSPNAALPSETALPGAATDRYMKRCPPGEDKVIRYSRPPTLTKINDIVVSGSGVVTFTTVAGDPDIPAWPETLTLTVNSFNPGMTGPVTVVASPTAGAPDFGVGTYTFSFNIPSQESAFSFVQISATDGVTTTTSSFRIIIPTDEDGSGCGGGMGLALLGVPLAAWFIRRRRRG